MAKKKSKKVNFLIRMAIFAVLLLLFMAISIAVLASVPVESLEKTQQMIDVMWWKASILRWIILAFIIVKILPWYINRQLEKFSSQAELFATEYEIAESKNATYETLCQLSAGFDNCQRMQGVYERMQKNRRYISLGLIAVELIAVQMPHFI